MSIIFSTIAPARPAGPPPARSYFEAPDDALLARVTEKVASILGRHRAYTFHEPSEVPAGLVPVVLSRAEVCPELALDTGRTQEAPRRAFWRLGDRAIKVPERPVGEADYSTLEQRVLAHSMEQLAGHIAYEMSRITVMDMPTARALVDATVRVLTSKGPLTPDDLRHQPPLMTATEINALPPKAREYIHQLVANTDPAGMVRENMQLRDMNKGLQLMYRNLHAARVRVVPGSLVLKEYPRGRTLTDNGGGHLIDQAGRSVATIDYETGTILTREE